MPGLFAPRVNPSFELLADYTTQTLRTPFDAGYVQTQPMWPREKRRWKMRWKSANQETRDYVVGFFQRQLGGANPWSWQHPTAATYQPAPALAPALWFFAGGALIQRTYYVVFTWANALGETGISARDSITVLANNRLRVEVPRFPAGVTSAKVYVGTTAGSETLQGTISTSNGQFDEPASGLVVGAAFPTTNTLQEVMTLHFEQDTLQVIFKGPGVFDLSVEAVELLA